MQIHRCLLSIPLPEVRSRFSSGTIQGIILKSHLPCPFQAAQIMLRVGDLRSYCRFMAQVGIRPSQNGGPGSEEKHAEGFIAENFTHGRWFNLGGFLLVFL